MHPSQIKAALEMRGVSLSDVAQHCGKISRNAVSLVVLGRSRSRRVESMIAALLEQPLQELWPKWYDAEGRRISRRRRSIDQVVRQFARAQAMLRKAA